MVHFFKIVHEGKQFLAYMGEHKEENETLIEYSWDEDVWFHVDNLSSAHVYIRLPDDMKITTIPPVILEQLAQLCKANSIKGSKLDNVKIVYTPTTNLKKTKGMETGQVGFHDTKLMYYTTVPTKKNEIINELNRNKVTKDTKVFIDLKNKRLAKLRKEAKKAKERAKKELEAEMAEARRLEEQQSYADVMDPYGMVSNTQMTMSAEDYEDGFM